VKEYQSVFKRVEKKYLLSEAQYMALRQLLEDHMKADRYANNTICNIYYDTPDGRLIRASLEKPVYKEKLRMRSYGTPDQKSVVFIELKKKFDGVVYKRRADLPLWEARDYLRGTGRPEEAGGKEQILREIDWFMQFYGNIRPAMFLAYDRSAFCGKENAELRLTFDSRIRYRTEALDLTAGVWGKDLLEPGQRLMEVKLEGAMPLWLSEALAGLSIYPASFSKYGKAYLKELERRNVTDGERQTADEKRTGPEEKTAGEKRTAVEEQTADERRTAGKKQVSGENGAAGGLQNGERKTGGGRICA